MAWPICTHTIVVSCVSHPCLGFILVVIQSRLFPNKYVHHQWAPMYDLKMPNKTLDIRMQFFQMNRTEQTCTVPLEIQTLPKPNRIRRHTPNPTSLQINVIEIHRWRRCGELNRQLSCDMPWWIEFFLCMCECLCEWIPNYILNKPYQWYWS